ncbi:Male sterility protein [Nesidiocoris tenuis]|uniref:Fatty acyl-CoA reductase n=2 Tax=Nesidiocoris tenuis TaxID=355587 RepID=A0ABN7A530_9HEMI|nr:Male sterility protein [Nesidiocoris tenuis]
MAASQIKDFYKGKNIFLTGGSGFVGVCLIEKLIRCTEVNKIYLLLRPKKGKAASERLDELEKNSVFTELLKDKGPDCVRSRICILSGDVGEENLGLSTADRQTIIDNVHIVFHSAATLDFEANLRTTVTINLLGTRRIVQLCKQIRHLEALLHVSSAYVNSHMLSPEEKIYPIPRDADEVISLVQSSTDEELDLKTPSTLGEFLNTYTFTKALAEREVVSSISSFPSTIVRPSQIIAAWKEPVPGWTISKNGPQGFLMGALKGVVRRLPVDRSVIADYIPVDIVINGMIVGAWHAATTKPSETPIFHLTSSTCNPFQWHNLASVMDSLMHRYPLKGAVWYPTLKLHPSLFMFRLSALIFHWIPAYILDTVARVTGGRPILVRMHTNIGRSLVRLEPFIFTEWKFDNKRTMVLYDSLSDNDKKLFDLDIRPMVWIDFFDKMALGVRTYLHNENPSSLPAGRKKDKVLKLLNYLIQSVFILLLWTAVTAVSGTTYSGTMFTVLPSLIVALSVL